jgi:hypothetical protein
MARKPRIITETTTFLRRVRDELSGTPLGTEAGELADRLDKDYHGGSANKTKKRKAKKGKR